MPQRDMPQRNLAVKLLLRLLKNDIKSRGAGSVEQGPSCAEMLKRSLNQAR
jgi:hypothetical protein